MTQYLPLLLLATFLYACNNTSGPERSYPITQVTDADFQDTVSASVQLHEGFKLDLWAPGPLLKNAVAIDFDPSGAAYVAETNRRKSSDLDIRDHRDWITEDLGLESMEDTRDFHLRKLASENSDLNLWLEDFNGDSIRDYRDLTVQTEIIRKVWDSDGDGRADASTVYADGFNDMLSGVAAGVMYENGDVYLTVAPDVYRLRDQDGDHHADERTVISHGYGIHIAYAGHDMSGLVMGPDGKVYWSIGDMGVNTTGPDGKHWVYPHEGCVMRCNPDGSEFEVFAHGLRNPQELAFDAYGNLISVDNDGDHPGEHERFVHILQGSDSGWRTYWQFGKYNEENEGYKIWMDERLSVPHFEGQAAYLLPPLALASDGPAGLLYNPGTALGSAWNNYFFASFFTGSSARSKIQAFRLEPQGASFRVAETTDLLVGIVSTGLAWGPEGALYINDWLDSYDKKPEGRIWKLDVEQGHPERANTRQLLQADLSQKSDEELQKLLAHDDMRVRMQAQFTLVRKAKTTIFENVLQQQNPQLARLHSLWGMGQLIRQQKTQADVLLSYLQDEDPEVRAQTARVMGETHFAAALDPLIQKLRDPSERVQYFAAEALGKLGQTKAFDPLVALLASTGDQDPHMRHGITHALAQLNAEKQLIALASHPSVDVRLGAVVALRQMRSPGLANFLNDNEPLLRTEAARAIHDDLSVAQALPALAESLEGSSIQDEAYLRRAINANLRIGGAAAAERLARFANKAQAPLAMRSDALWALGYWDQLPLLDRVEGRYRKIASHPLAEAQNALAAIAPVLLASGPVEMQQATLLAIGRLRYEKMEPDVLQAFNRTQNPLALRQAALKGLVALQSTYLTKALESALQSPLLELRTQAQADLGDIDLPPATIAAMLGKVLAVGTPPEQQQALQSLGSIHDPAAIALLGQWLDKLKAGKADPVVQLDIINAIKASEDLSLNKALADYQAAKPADDPVAALAETMYGGNARRGGRIFYLNTAAECVRCHAYNGNGGAVGPELTHIGSVLTPEQLLAAIVDPSARLAPGYGSVRLSLKDGSKVTGVIMEETTTHITIKVGQEDPRAVALSDVSEKQYFPSAMPTMKEVLTPTEIRDVIAFLSSSK